MNSENVFENSNDHKENYPFNKSSPVDFSLSYDQYVFLQHYLPKRFSLLQYKSSKRNQNGSAIKIAPQDVQNFSRPSNNFQNTEQNQGRSKRPKPKKIDRFLQNQIAQKPSKRSTSERFSLNLDDQMGLCYNLLVSLKKHKSAYPFLQPVDPKLDGAYNYLDIIKQPMDLATVEMNLKNGDYQTATQFHGDINKIWMNSYAYNQKTSPLYKITVQIQKYYKNLCNNQGITKKTKVQQKSKTKQMKQTKKDSFEKNQQKQSQVKQFDKKSISGGGGNQKEFQDSDEFMYDK